MNGWEGCLICLFFKYSSCVALPPSPSILFTRLLYGLRVCHANTRTRYSLVHVASLRPFSVESNKNLSQSLRTQQIPSGVCVCRCTISRRSVLLLRTWARVMIVYVCWHSCTHTSSKAERHTFKYKRSRNDCVCASMLSVHFAKANKRDKSTVEKREHRCPVFRAVLCCALLFCLRTYTTKARTNETRHKHTTGRSLCVLRVFL